MHRIGRTEELKKKEILFYFLQKKSRILKNKIEELMNFEIPMVDFPKQVEISLELIDEEKAGFVLNKNENRNSKRLSSQLGFTKRKRKT